MVAILHDLNLAALLADRIVVLDGGRIAGDGPPRETITEAMLHRVFGVAAAVGRVPPARRRSCCRTRRGRSGAEEIKIAAASIR